MLPYLTSKKKPRSARTTMHAPTGIGETPTNTAGRQEHPRRLKFARTGEGCGILPPRE
jgi:hypothetical protein